VKNRRTARTCFRGQVPQAGSELLAGARLAHLGDRLNHLLPARRRPRIKTRTRKNATSKYGQDVGQHPARAQTYTVHTDTTIFEKGIAPRSRT